LEEFAIQIPRRAHLEEQSVHARGLPAGAVADPTAIGDGNFAFTQWRLNSSKRRGRAPPRLVPGVVVGADAASR
jgi:hypothetical protein